MNLFKPSWIKDKKAVELRDYMFDEGSGQYYICHICGSSYDVYIDEETGIDNDYIKFKEKHQHTEEEFNEYWKKDVERELEYESRRDPEKRVINDYYAKIFDKRLLDKHDVVRFNKGKVEYDDRS